MRRLPLALLLFACHSAATAPDAAVTTPTTGDAGQPADASSGIDAGGPSTVRLLDLDGGAPRRARATGGVLLCDTHQVWTPPAGFTVTRVGSDVIARKDDTLVGVAEVAHADDTYSVAAARYVSRPLTWDTPSMNRIDAWHAESTVHGRGAGMVVVVRTLYAGVDPTSGKGRAGVTLTSSRLTDVLWLAAAPTEKAAGDLLEAARKATLTLVDHACECGYDCYRK